MSNRVQAGYTKYGVTISILGTMIAMKRVVLIEHIELELKIPGQSRARIMDWFAFRPLQASIDRFSEIEMTLPTKFTVSPEKEHEYNVLFIDNAVYKQLKPVSQAVLDTWNELKIPQAQKSQVVDTQKLFKDFTQTKIYKEALERYRSANVWQPGNYFLKLRVITQNPRQVLSFKRRFVISSLDYQMLFDNAEILLMDLCQIKNIVYNCSAPLLFET